MIPRLCGGGGPTSTSSPAAAGRSASRSSGPPRGVDEREAARELFAAVSEFLQFHGFLSTLEAFTVEKQTWNERRATSSSQPEGKDAMRAPAKLLERFDAGRREEFFALWERHVPAAMLARDIDTTKLEFYLQIYFALFPILKERGSGHRGTSHRSSSMAQEELAIRLRGFKLFLETRGSELARTGEFLPFYALPYVGSPAEHPSFKELVGGAWAKELRTQLDIFLQTIPATAPRPALYAMLDATRGILRAEHGSRPVSRLLRGDEDLDGVIRSKRVGSSLAEHSYSDEFSALVEPARSSTPTRLEDSRAIAPLSPIQPALGLSDSLGSLPGILKQSLALDGGGGPQMRSAFQQAILPPLDYQRIMADLRGAENTTASSLLQALRWRISKSPPGKDRLRVIMTFVERDVFSISQLSPSLIEPLADRCDGPVAEELARLLNCMASAATGRTYLLQPGGETVKTLKQLLTATPAMDSLNAPVLLAHEGADHMASDSLLQQHALGALQKLSLLRRAQSEMIQLGAIGSICTLLTEGLSSLSEYTVEYSMALLMNLSLRSAGKRACENCDVLSVLDSLIESSNPQVRTYVNGTLYSVLQRSSIREAARARGLGDFLKSVAANSEEVFARQIRYIQVQLNSNAPDDCGQPSDDEEEFEDIDEEGEDDGEDVDELEAIEGSPVKGELLGEELLCEHYLADTSLANQEDRIMKESMEIATATMNMAKYFKGRGGLGRTIRTDAVAASLAGEVLQRPSTPSSFNASIRSGKGASRPSHLSANASALPSRAHSSSASGSRAARAAPQGSDRRAASARGSPAKGIMSLATPQQPGKAESPSGLVASRRQTSSADSTGPASSRRASLTVDEQSLSSAAGESSTRSHPNSATSRRLSGSGSGKDPASIQQRAVHEAAALRAKLASERRDDPAGFAPTPKDYMQAFATKSELPRTPASRGRS